MKKEIYEGTDDYRKLIKDNGYYVDKTLLIEEWMKNKAEVTLITRPRRFGKTLNMTMMKEFFDITTDSKDIFEGTKIMDKPECIKRMNKVPVVFYSFKSCDGKNKRQLLVALKKVIFSEFERYGKIFGNSNKIPEDTFIRFIEYKEIMRSSTVDVEQIEDILPDSILLLTQVLYEYYKIKPIVIIDEYDYPFIEAKVNGYYDEINTILSTMFCEAFKGNKYLDKGIMTGIQKIAQESIFSKFNNPSICSVVDKKYFNKFGLTENETKEYLEYFDYELTDEVKKFYDGYKFNGEDIYNPMSITRYISEDGELERYWVNTSSNVLIKEEIPRASDEFKETFEQLVKNKSCVTNISLNTTFSKKYSDSGLWGLFLNAGYITAEKKIRNNRYRVKIPNEEVRSEFKEIVADYINVKSETLDSLFDALLDKDMDQFIKIYKKIVLKCTSYYDAVNKENSYHMLMLGMTMFLEPDFRVESNNEAGKGRPDISIYAKRENDMNVIMEFKYIDSDADDNKKELLSKADEALNQIKDNEYYAKMKGSVLMLGIAHDKKEVEIKHEVINV